jgi:glycosyltransferase involved in cell wall biosynthesis
VAECQTKMDSAIPGNRELKILQLCASSASSGAENHIVALSQGLLERGHDVLVAVPRGGWLQTNLEAKQVPVRSMKMKDLDYWISIVKLVGIVRKRRIDILHTHLSRAACIGHAVGRLTGVPVVATAHVRNTARIYKRLARGRNRLIAVSQFGADLLAGNRIPKKFIRTIYHGTDFADTEISCSSEAVKLEFGIPAERAIIGLVGKVCRDKGQLELIRATSQLVSSGLDLHVMLIGRSDEKYLQKLQREITELELQDRVLFAGTRDDVARLIDSFTISVLPSCMETFGLAAVESSARGKPVVATRVGAIPEIIRDMETGILVDLNPSSIATAIGQLLNDPQMLSDMGERGRQWVRSEFTVAKMVDKTESLYQEVSDLRLRAGKSRVVELLQSK